MKTFATTLCALLISLANALDITLKSIECEDMPISLVNNSMTMDCNGRYRCPLGNEANLYGKLRFRGVGDTGLVDGYAFVSATLELKSLEYQLLHYLQVPMCGAYVTVDESNEGECPEDGIYDFTMPYVLPEEEPTRSWLASGWKGTSEIAFFSEANNIDSVIGRCNLHLATAVTPSSSENLLSKIPVPSAMVTVFAVLAFASFIVLSCLYRLIRDVLFGKSKKKKGLLLEDDGTYSSADSTGV